MLAGTFYRALASLPLIILSGNFKGPCKKGEAERFERKLPQVESSYANAGTSSGETGVQLPDPGDTLCALAGGVDTGAGRAGPGPAFEVVLPVRCFPWQLRSCGKCNVTKFAARAHILPLLFVFKGRRNYLNMTLAL